MSLLWHAHHRRGPDMFSLQPCQSSGSRTLPQVWRTFDADGARGSSPRALLTRTTLSFTSTCPGGTLEI